jgi:16S rRNA (cytosine1402-N4)-methyltransferase
MNYFHQPVLVAEVLNYLALKPSGKYIDATFGRGGHTREILSHLGQSGFLLALDKDPYALTAISDELRLDERFVFCRGSFAAIREFAAKHNLLGKTDGILLDLGVSSPQLDDPGRGFSFLQAGPLDMRMDTTQGRSAADWLKTAKESEIALILKEYGEERFAKRIANAIVQERMKEPITTTDRLAAIVKKANPAWERHKHPATRSFQAIRIFINSELSELQECLEQCLDVLAIGGRLVVISFHSLEDRIVKRFFRDQSEIVLPKRLPIRQSEISVRLRKVAGPIIPTETEVKENQRARSAKLRVAEKLK